MTHETHAELIERLANRQALAWRLQGAILDMADRYSAATLDSAYASMAKDYERAAKMINAQSRRYKALIRLTTALASLAADVTR